MISRSREESFWKARRERDIFSEDSIAVREGVLSLLWIRCFEAVWGLGRTYIGVY